MFVAFIDIIIFKKYIIALKIEIILLNQKSEQDRDFKHIPQFRVYK